MLTTQQSTSPHSSLHLRLFGRKAILPVEIEVAKEQPAQIVSEPEKDIDTEAVKHLSEKRIEILKSACDNIRNAQAKQKLIYDRKHACPNSYRVGDVVLKKDFLRRKRAGGKLDSRFTGPYIISKVINKGQYTIHTLNEPK